MHFAQISKRLKAEDAAESQELGERLKEMKYHSLVKRNDCKECSFFLPLDTVLLLQVGCSSKKQRHTFLLTLTLKVISFAVQSIEIE